MTDQSFPDIVERLREPRLTAYHGLRNEAADEIERLRAAWKDAEDRADLYANSRPAAAQRVPTREQIAQAVYASWLDADFCTENHFEWFDAGKDNPDSCVHYSNVAKALKVADRILALSQQHRQEAKP